MQLPTYCPGSMVEVEHPKSKSTGGFYRPGWSPCTNCTSGSSTVVLHILHRWQHAVVLAFRIILIFLQYLRVCYLFLARALPGNKASCSFPDGRAPARAAANRRSRRRSRTRGRTLPNTPRAPRPPALLLHTSESPVCLRVLRSSDSLLLRPIRGALQRKPRGRHVAA